MRGRYLMDLKPLKPPLDWDDWFLIILLSLAALTYLIASAFAQDIPVNDPYIALLKQGWFAAKKWNPSEDQTVNADFMWSTWQGCENLEYAETYLSLCVNEGGLSLLDNEFYYGRSGCRWYVIIDTLERMGMKRPDCGWRPWIRRHPYDINRIMARHF